LQVPLKPEPKECTKAEPFQLESLVRHQEEQQRQAEERAKAEQIEAALKEFHACPNLSKYSSSSSPSWLSLNMS
jgi:targeting protein for Xklp2